MPRPPGDHPVRSVEDGYRQVSIELRYVGSARAADYLARDLSERVALPPCWGADALYGGSVVGVPGYVGGGAGLVCGAGWGWTGKDVHQL